MIDIEQFCADEYEPRRHLQVPMKYGTSLVASNGHFIVELFDLLFDDDPKVHKKVKSLLDKLNKLDHGQGVDLTIDSLPPEPKRKYYLPMQYVHRGYGKVEFLGAFVSYGYLRQIAELPGVKIGKFSKERDPYWFTFDGGRGYLMPIIGGR